MDSQFSREREFSLDGTIRVGDLVFIKPDAKNSDDSLRNWMEYILGQIRRVILIYTHTPDNCERIKIEDFGRGHNYPNNSPKGWILRRQSVEKIECDEHLKELLQEI